MRSLEKKGVKLSGGQKQRIAIARAFVKNSPFLLLDEATSSLDSRSEKKIQTSLNNLMKNKTSLVIAHRLSTIIDADKIILLHNGKIVEIDKHENLLKNLKSIKTYSNYNLKKKMIKKILQHKYVQELAGWIIAFILKFVLILLSGISKNDEEFFSFKKKKE